MAINQRQVKALAHLFSQVSNTASFKHALGHCSGSPAATLPANTGVTAVPGRGLLVARWLGTAAATCEPTIAPLATAYITAAKGRRIGALTNLKQLFKLKLSSLVMLTTSAGFVLGSGDEVDLARLAWVSLGTLGAAAAANALNQAS
jgi:hypothetical protein